MSASIESNLSMKTKKTLLAVAILSMIALTGSQAQTATPTPDPRTGTYQDAKLSIPQRLQLANSVLTSGTDCGAVVNAANFMLGARPVIHLLNAYPAFADSVLSDPTLGGKISGDRAAYLKCSAINFHVDATPGLDDKIAYLSEKIRDEAAAFTDAQLLGLKSGLAKHTAAKAAALYGKGDYAGAVSTASGVLGFGGAGSPEILQIFRAKIALRSPDVLSWAKLVYFQSPFAQTQAGIDAVSSAYRALDANLVRANAFIQYQKDGTGANPLADVPLPKVSCLGATPAAMALNNAAAGDNLAALKTAFNEFSIAPSGSALNGATALVAQWLRNIDGNLVRANAFVSAQSNGEAFTISEFAK